jgi:hypothetical protein
MLQICSEHSVDFSIKKKEETTEEISEESEEVNTPTPTPAAGGGMDVDDNSYTTPAPAPAPDMNFPTPHIPASDPPTVPATPQTPAPVPVTPAPTGPPDMNFPTPYGADGPPPPPEETPEEIQKKKEARQEKELKKQGIAVIGIALVAMGEEVGAEMVLRHFQHLVRLFFLPSICCPPFLALRVSSGLSPW